VRLIRTFARDRRGATAIEYALIAGMIFLVIVASVRLLGGATFNLYNSAGSKWTSAAG
jgi:pilus assembly protein Flp/PilA